MAPTQNLTSDDWTKITKLLPEGWQEQARECGALKFGRQFSSPEILLRVLLIYFCDGCSMRETVARAAVAGLVNISDVALLKRIDKSAEWLRWMTENLVKQTSDIYDIPPTISHRRLVAVDGCLVKEPGSQTPDWRLHYAMDIRTLNCYQSLITPVSAGETLTRFSVQEGDIVIADRGFTHRPGIKHIINQGGDVVARMNLRALPLLTAEDEKFEQLSYLRTLIPGGFGEWPARMVAEGKDYAVRVCAYRKTEEQRIESERKYLLHISKKQRKQAADVQEITGYVVVVTTLKELSAEDILGLYRQRWQIELAFKRMKSLTGLGYLKKKSPEGVQAWLQGKLFVACLLERLLAISEHFSPKKTG
ncbi:Transposase [Serratia quinivorans]|uniref:IS4 family transposase n=1 Tax=Serratia quinivorans TaxID=137545 RepID=UPI002177129B|nr:IS4 family transposase [Serratia quinivorans]CAI1616686.1 Transposase [Serratia quinivorans]